MRQRWFDKRPFVRAVMAVAGPRAGIRFAVWCDCDPFAGWFRSWFVYPFTHPRLWWELLRIRLGLPFRIDA